MLEIDGFMIMEWSDTRVEDGFAVLEDIGRLFNIILLVSIIFPNYDSFNIL